MQVNNSMPSRLCNDVNDNDEDNDVNSSYKELFYLYWDKNEMHYKSDKQGTHII